MTEAIAGLVGVLVGAILQHLLAARVEVAKHHQALRSTAYADLVRALAALNYFDEANWKEKSVEAAAAATDARVRVAVYGSASVASMFGEFFHDHAALSSDADRAALLGIVQAMRRETLPGAPLSDSSLEQLLFKSPLDG